MSWRGIGPAAYGGRIAAVAGSATDPKLYYVGAAGGGVWRSTNGAQSWDSVFDKKSVAAIGAVTIDPVDNKIVWVGTGEANPRNDVSYGDGVYKSTDGGDTWTNVGLKGTRHIARILVDPHNHNHVVVAALGDVFQGEHRARNLRDRRRGTHVEADALCRAAERCRRSSDERAKSKRDVRRNLEVSTPPVDLRQRRPRRRALPLRRRRRDLDAAFRPRSAGRSDGRIGIAVAPSDGNRVYAAIESTEGVLWRSDDGGANWTMVSKDSLVNARPFYFTHVEVDPKDPNRVYALSFQTMLSTDGGKTFKAIARDVHPDFHAIWIAPNDPTRLMLGEDGGYALTLDKGATWFFSANLPIGQIYRVGLGTDDPYTVCVGLQDNNGWCGPSNSLDQAGHSKSRLDQHRRRRRPMGCSRTRRSELDLVGCAKRRAVDLQPRDQRRVERPTLSANGQRIVESGDEQVSLQLGIADCVCAMAELRR